jgi:hypothetical protein
LVKMMDAAAVLRLPVSAHLPPVFHHLPVPGLISGYLAGNKKVPPQNFYL